MASLTTSAAGAAPLPEVSSASSAAGSPSPSSSPFSSKTATPTATASSHTELDIVFHPNDVDVLCGRGRAVRLHPGNQVYNDLLRDGYDEYTNAKKGTKLDIVRRIVVEIRDERGGRFLEKLVGGGNYYIDIGNERAMNKTAQAFRDMRVAETNGTAVTPPPADGTAPRGKDGGRTGLPPAPSSSSSVAVPKASALPPTTKPTAGGASSGSCPARGVNTSASVQRPATKNAAQPTLPRRGLLPSSISGNIKGSALSAAAVAAARARASTYGTLPGQPRRLSFSERVKLLHQQRRGGSDDDSDDDSDDESGSEGGGAEKNDGSEKEDGGEVSETETEDSFPTYSRKKHEG